MLCHSHQPTVDFITELSQSWGMQCCVVQSNTDASNKLLEDKQTYQVLMIEDDKLTPELQMNLRQSNVDHKFTTSVIVLNSKQLITNDEMKKRGIQCLLSPPLTTAGLYQNLVHSMGIHLEQQHRVFNENFNVLVVEDNNIHLMVITGMLKKSGVIADVAKNGLEALYRAKNTNYHLIFMDFEMPEMNGYDATKAIRALEQENLTETPCTIIGLSAHASSDYKSRAEDAGMNDFLTKPINSEDFDNLLNPFMHNAPTASKKDN